MNDDNEEAKNKEVDAIAHSALEGVQDTIKDDNKEKRKGGDGVKQDNLDRSID